MKGGRRLLTKIERPVFSGFAGLWLRPLNQKAKKGIQVILILTLVTWMSFSILGTASDKTESNRTRLNCSFLHCSGEDGGCPALSSNPDSGLA